MLGDLERDKFHSVLRSSCQPYEVIDRKKVLNANDELVMTIDTIQSSQVIIQLTSSTHGSHVSVFYEKSEFSRACEFWKMFEKFFQMDRFKCVRNNSLLHILEMLKICQTL